MGIILAFLAALPTLWAIFKQIQGAAQGDPLAYLKRVQGVMDQLKAAKTSEDKANAAKAIHDLIGS